MRIDNNKKYWLCLDPNTFIFNGDKEYVVYNSLSKKLLRYDTASQKTVISVLDMLMDMDNMYSLPLDGLEIKEKKIGTFIDDLREGYFGDLLEMCFFNKKPAIFPPVVNIKNSVQNLNNDQEISSRQTFLRFLHELTIYLNGHCSRNCQNCEDYKRQFIFCSKSNNDLPFNELSKLLSFVDNSSITHVNLVGGDIFQYEFLNEAVHQFSELGRTVSVYTHFLNLNIERVVALLNKNVLVNVLVTHLPDLNVFCDLFEQEGLLRRCKWVLVVSTQSDFEAALSLIEHEHLENAGILPYYDGKNNQFFEEQVFTTIDDIIDTSLESQDIFARQSINLHNYGKIIITPDLRVLTNFNSDQSHPFEEDPVRNIMHEMNTSSFWFLTRDRIKPCNQCAFRYLCPSPSNYESVIGRSNLCMINPS